MSTTSVECPFASAVSLGNYLDDVSKLRLFKQVWEENTSYCCVSKEATYTFWDSLSILAYYQKEYETAQTAYKMLIHYHSFPASEQDRIYRNAQFYDKGNNLSYEVCKRHISSLPQNKDVIHFIYLKGVSFGFHHYLCVLSAAKQCKSPIVIYNDIEPSMEESSWWQKVKTISNVKVQCIYPPTFCNGTEVRFKQHQADIIRLLLLQHMGGLYLDLDMFMLHDVRKNVDTNASLCICRESKDGLCNAFIYATKPNSTMIKTWISTYETQYDGHYTKWSITTPHMLSEQYPEEVVVLPTECFYPFDYMHTAFFTSPNDTLGLLQPNKMHYGVHLWETENAKRNILPTSFASFREGNSLFYQLAQQHLTEAFAQYDMEELKGSIASLHQKVDALKEMIEMCLVASTTASSLKNSHNNVFEGLSNIIKL